MKKLAALLLTLWPALAFGATKYANVSCTNNGDGSTQACASTPGGAGPWNSIAQVASNATCGSGGVPTTVNVAIGEYNFNNVTFSQSCSATNELIIQANGWTGNGYYPTSGVYFENLQQLTSADWHQCSTCDGADNAACNGIVVKCNTAWYHTPSAGKKALWAETPSGGITPRQTALANLSASFDAYGADAADAALTVLWGTTLPTHPWTNNENNQYILQITGDYIIIRGINFRYGLNAAINVTTTSDHATIQDNSFKYFNDSGNGSSRAVFVDGATGPAEVIYNEFAYDASEPIHATTVTNGTCAVHFAHNWVHDIGKLSVLGPGTAGTPNCTTFTSDAPCCSYSTVGNFSGSIVEDNLFDGCGNTVNSSGRKAILMESHCDNLVVRSNIIAHAGTCFKFHPSNGGTSNHTSSNQIYNNLCLYPQIGDSTGVQFRFEGPGPMQNNVIYNNTFVGADGGAIQSDNDATITGNLIRNNILYYNGTIKQVQFNATDATNHFDNNLVTISGSGNAVTWGASSYACSALNTLGSGNINNCPDPVFVGLAGNDFHIQTSSPAKDAGTATGMPAGRTTDINNTIASAHGYPPYNDATPIQNGTWDIGIDEFQTGGGTVVLDISKVDAPDPVIAGQNITYTLTYHNTGSASATNAIIADFVPQGTTFVSAANGGVYFPNGGNGPPGSVAWSIGTVAAGGNGTVSFVVSVPSSTGSGTVIHNDIYAITSDQTGTVLASNPDTTTVTNSATRRGRIFPHGR